MGFSKGNVEKCRICTFLEFLFDFGLTLMSLEDWKSWANSVRESPGEARRRERKEGERREGTQQGLSCFCLDGAGGAVREGRRNRRLETGGSRTIRSTVEKFASVPSPPLCFPLQRAPRILLFQHKQRRPSKGLFGRRMGGGGGCFGSGGGGGGLGERVVEEGEPKIEIQDPTLSSPPPSNLKRGWRRGPLLLYFLL